MAIDVFADKLAIVTGGASGIGRAVGEGLVRRGAHVWLADIDFQGAERTAKALGGPGTARAVAVDVTDAAAVEAMVSGAFREYHRLDFLFNNAGIAVCGDARRMSLDDWNALIDVNIRGVVHGVAAAYPRMIEQGHGHIVNTASVAGLVPVPSFTGYAMTKHAVVGLSTSLRFEAERFGVSVSVVCPGVVDTPILERLKMLGMEREAFFAEQPIELYPVEKCAEQILRGVERRKDVIPIVPRAKFVWRLHRFLPRLNALLTRHSVKRNPLLR